MPNVNVYLPDEMYVKYIKEKNKSELVQRLLKEHWAKGE